MIAYLKAQMRANFGGWSHRVHHKQLVESVPSIQDSIATFRKRWPETDEVRSAERPVILLSSTWRAGSTALQRLVVSSNTALIWGEPYHNCNFVQSLADGLRSVSETHPTDRDMTLDRGKKLSDSWIANLCPSGADLKRSHIAFFESLFAAPAKAAGYERWGIKEVRFDASHMAYIAWLFPEARFVLLHRDPYAAYRSYRFFETWYNRWPSEPILSARQFGEHWLRLTRDFIDAEHRDDCRLFSFHELTMQTAKVAAELERHLGFSVDPCTLDRVVSGRGKQRDKKRPDPVPGPELRALRAVVGELASTLGYEMPAGRA